MKMLLFAILFALLAVNVASAQDFNTCDYSQVVSAGVHVYDGSRDGRNLLLDTAQIAALQALDGTAYTGDYYAFRDHLQAIYHVDYVNADATIQRLWIVVSWETGHFYAIQTSKFSVSPDGLERENHPCRLPFEVSYDAVRAIIEP